MAAGCDQRAVGVHCAAGAWVRGPALVCGRCLGARAGVGVRPVPVMSRLADARADFEVRPSRWVTVSAGHEGPRGYLSSIGAMIRAVLYRFGWRHSMISRSGAVVSVLAAV